MEEPGAPHRGGRWCGEGSGMNVYYSESNSVNVVLIASSSSQQGEYFDNPLHLKIRSVNSNIILYILRLSE